MDGSGPAGQRSGHDVHTPQPRGAHDGRVRQRGEHMSQWAGSTRSRRTGWIAGMALVALTASACASGGGSGRAAGEADDAGGTVNMVMAPDPVWKWLEDQGIKQEMEQKAGMQVLTSSSWDEFGVFAGGHADVISASTYEVPDLEESIGEPTT